MNIVHSSKLKNAIRFATQVHEIDQKQKRKGKDIPYITHPLAVGLLLSQVGASTDVVVAGILHDTLEDAHPDYPVTPEMIEQQFGKEVLDLVESVTEPDKGVSYDERKQEALAHVKIMTHDQILLKSADVLSNMEELIADYREHGDLVFERFNTDKETKLLTQIRLIQTLVTAWKESPLAQELCLVAAKAVDMGGIAFLQKYSSKKLMYREYDLEAELTCPLCGWHGTAEDHMETFDACIEVHCGVCLKTLVVAEFSMA